MEAEADDQGWQIGDGLVMQDIIDFMVDMPKGSGEIESSNDVSFGRYFYSFCNPFSNFVLKHLTYEFYYYFLEYFFVSVFRIIFLLLFYFAFFIFRGVFFFFIKN